MTANFADGDEAFQSARPRGTRFDCQCLICDRCCVSIRASAGDAIPVGIATSTLTCVFQSARPRGTRFTVVSGELADSVFQSARPRGTRFEFFAPISLTRVFQSARPRGTRLASLTPRLMFS